MENKSSNPLGNMGGKQAFGFGLVAGFLVLCAIGFFILLGIMLNGGAIDSDKSSGKTGSEDVDGPKKFSECLDTDKYASAVNADMQLGSSLGVRGTPATFVNGYLMSGALPYDMAKQVIDALLAGEEPDFEFMKDDAGNLTKVDMPELKDVVWRGEKDAPITIVEFSDFECPYCARFVPTVEQVLANYGDDVRFTFRHFPLSFHQQAQKAAEAFECAKEQGKAFEMHDELFVLSEAGTMSVTNFKKAATQLGLK
ncbi:MAG: thioredoxin domain-containing protein [Candidatus Magasanikbacteria bacterium]|jgi:protein-disulfide isomerase|nr:thioredoxin domain-containing protein [Candidatus Magasanikbacteria bacterium]MBT4314791.1 thioredoxin domain-containing protein [Candidatus Magasanikbacteria bacterium]MBT4547568.1 thioredoxin domain-containing protein [Candidatus Magasanikbacteria bacterium]MBT6818817.1 thioredoxin domain-containing protein [Candidatus Magasanikbacteria bacterium]